MSGAHFLNPAFPALRQQARPVAYGSLLCHLGPPCPGHDHRPGPPPPPPPLCPNGPPLLLIFLPLPSTSTKHSASSAASFSHRQASSPTLDFTSPQYVPVVRHQAATTPSTLSSMLPLPFLSSTSHHSITLPTGTVTPCVSMLEVLLNDAEFTG
jgi:hypothetical protein